MILEELPMLLGQLLTKSHIISSLLKTRGYLGFNVAVISVLSLLSNSSIASINAESTRTESKNNFLLVYNYLSVILIILVAVYSIISLAIVSIIEKAVIDPEK